MVFKSSSKLLGPIPNDAAAIDGSEKYLVSVVRMDVFDLKFGFHAGESSITNQDKNKVFPDQMYLIDLLAYLA